MGTTSTDVKFRLAMEGAAVVSSEMDRVNAALGKIEGGIGTVKHALGLLGVGLSVDYFVGMIRGSIDAADHLNDLSKTTSIAVETLAGLKLAAKQSGGDLDSIAASINKLSVNMGKDAEQFAKLGVTAKDPLEAFKQLADVFSTLKDPQLRAALGAEALGKSWAGAAPALSEGGAKIQEMVDKGIKLSGVTREMAEKADIFNDRLAEMETVSDRAKTNLAIEMLPTLTKLTTAFVDAYEEGGKLHALWIVLGGLGALAFTDEFASTKTKLNQVNKDLEQIYKRQNDIKNAGSVVKFLYGSDELDSEANRLSKLKRDLQAEIDKPALDAAARAVDTKARIADAKAEAEATRKTTEFLKLNEEARKKAAAAAEAAIKAQDSFVKGLQKEHDSLILGTEQAKLNEAATLGITGAKLKLVTTLLDEDRVYKLAVITAKEHAALRQKESDGIDAYMLAQTESYNAAVKGSQDALTAAQAEYNQLGLSKSQIAETTLLTMQSTQAKSNDGTEGFNALQKQIDKQKELIGVLRKTEMRQVGIDTAKAVADEWKHGWEETDRIAREAFTGWAENGKSMAETIGGALKKALLSAIYEATIKPIALNVYTSITGGPGGSGGSSAFGMAGNAASLYNMGTAAGIGQGIANLLPASWSAGLGMTSTALMTSNIATGVSVGLTGAEAATAANAAAVAGNTAALGSVGTALSAIPVWGWGALAAVALLGFGDHGKPTSSTGSAGMGFDAAGNRTSYVPTVDGGLQTGSNPATDAVLLGLQASYMALAKTLDIGTRATGFFYGGNTGANGESPNFALGGGAIGHGISQVETPYTDAAVQLAASRAVFSALQGSELPKYLTGLFNTLDASSATQQQITDTLTYAQSLKTVRDALTETRTPLQILADNMKTLGTTTDTFKTDFVKAIDAGIGPQQLAQWQSLQQSMEQLTPAVAAATVAVRSLADIANERTKLQDQLDNLTMTSAQLLDKQRAALDGSNRSLWDQVQAATNAKDAANKLTQSTEALRAANQGWQDQLDVLTGKETDRSIALRDAGDDSTRALMRQVYAQQDLKTATEAAAAAQAAFAANLTASMDSAQGGLQSAIAAQRAADHTAVQAAAQVAQAVDQAANAIRDALASAGQGIADFVKTLRGSIASPADLAASYKTDLVLAQGGDVEASKRLPNSGRAYLDSQVAHSATAFDAAFATARMANELSALPAVKTYQDKLLEAVNATTTAVAGTTGAVVDLNGKLVVDLTVAARSEIVKLISFISNTDSLSPDLLALALKTADTFTKTVGFVTGSYLPDDLKALALASNTSLTKTIEFALASNTLAPDTMTLALATSSSISKTIALESINLIDPVQQQLALMTSADITKTFNAAVGANDPLAMAIALAQSGDINKLITVSGGALNADQAAVLSAIDVYNKTVNIDVVVSSGSLTAFQQLLMSTFGTIDISKIGNTAGAGGLNISEVVGQGALDRLKSIATYVSNLDWQPDTVNANLWSIYDVAKKYGVTQVDLANAASYYNPDMTYTQLVAGMDAAGIPRFAAGGLFDGGMRIVGEHGPELEVTGASRIWNAPQIASALQGGSSQQRDEALVAEIRALRKEVSELRVENSAENRAIVNNTRDSADRLSGRQGTPFLVELAAGAVVKVAP